MDEERFDREIEAAIEQIENAETKKLSELAKIAGLDLKRDFVGVDLSDEDLSNDLLSGADLSGANLSGADLSDANLSDANLSDANLSDADLSDADLSDVNLSGANLRNTIINEETKLDDKWRRLTNLRPQDNIMLIGRTLLSRYKIVSKIGSGGFADTYLAQDIALPDDPPRVVKHLKPKDPNPNVFPIAKRLFEREAEFLYRLGEHDQIPRLYAHFEEGGEFYLVEEFVDGDDLKKEIVPGKPLSEELSIKLLQEILEVLAVVHQQNIIHRDINLSNIMRRKRDGKLVLIDFGAVKEISVLTVNSQGQQSRTVQIGTPGYMPPEQAMGNPKLASDIYAVGMIVIQALTGVPPNQLETDKKNCEIIWRNGISVNDELADILDKMVLYDFRQRYQKAAEVIEVLKPPNPPPDMPEKPESNESLALLRVMFQDDSEVLKLLDLRNFDLQEKEAEKLIEMLREHSKLFAVPINLYVTGRTGAGKSSLGNSLLDESQNILKITGHMNCTSAVQFFKMPSNLCFYDLPGAGSNEDYENVNRAALLIEQIEDEDEEPPITKISEFELRDYSDFLNTGKPAPDTIAVEDWQFDEEYQEVFAPDVILYVVAPHMQFLKDDKRYLRALLKSQQKQSKYNKVIFALNLFTKDGVQMSTPENIEDAKNKIIETYQKIYEDAPPIVEIDSKTGKGISEVTEFISQLLPQEKLGKLKKALGGKLKQIAQKELNRQFLNLVIRIACRIANYKVDQKVGEKELLREIALAISTYAVMVFGSADTADERKINKIIEADSQKVKKKQTEKIIETRPEYKDKKVLIETKPRKPKKVREEVKKIVNKPGFMNKLKRGAGFLLGNEDWGKEVEIETITQKIPRPPKKIYQTIKIVSGETTRVVGKEYLEGSYPVIKFLIRLGLGFQSYFSAEDSSKSLKDCQKDAELVVERKLSPFKSEIEAEIKNKTPDTEQKLIQILEQALKIS
ncbi:MAG: pentapeptide repeat-containing protein [Xenococcus sp. MO_188.B8]|nr:pentapeptide repeat-containing protein [Xenococcus sp. MO_188.B8]